MLKMYVVITDCHYCETNFKNLLFNKAMPAVNPYYSCTEIAVKRSRVKIMYLSEISIFQQSTCARV